MKRFNRRTFINKTLHGTAGALAGSQVVVRVAASAGLTPPSPCSPTAWEKHGIVVKPTEVWEGGRIQNFTCPAEPLDNDRWRIWYSGTGSPRSFTIGYAEGVLGGPMKKCPARLSAGDPPDAQLAIGNLPKDWKPVQVIHIQLQNGSFFIRTDTRTDPPLRAPETSSLVALDQSHFVASSAPDFASPRVIADHTVIAFPNPR